MNNFFFYTINDFEMYGFLIKLIPIINVWLFVKDYYENDFDYFKTEKWKVLEWYELLKIMIIWAVCSDSDKYQNGSAHTNSRSCPHFIQIDLGFWRV